MKRITSILLVAILLVACGSPDSKDKKEVKQETKTKYFKNNKMVIEDLEITIKSHEVVKDEITGEEQLLFVYDILNKKGDDIDPITGWQAVMHAYQDNNKNHKNELQVGGMPKKYHDIQLQTIKKDGTVECGATYKLTDKTTPVTLEAKLMLDDNIIGSQEFDIKK